MQNVLSQIPKAPASVAFHALIRLAYGLEADHSGEIAAGLAALVVCNMPLEVQRPLYPVRVVSVAEGLTQLTHSMTEFATSEHYITGRIRAVLADPRFALSLPTMPENPLDDMAVQAIRHYLHQRHFTALHLVTGLHAVRIVFAYLPATLFQQYLPSLWMAYCAAFIASTGITIPQEKIQSQHLQGWDTLFEYAKESTRDHMIKMMYTCHQEYLRVPDPEIKRHYLMAANAALIV